MPRLDASLRLYRRTVEVRDAALLLAPHRSAADTAEHRRRAEAAGLHGERADAAVEAADLALALQRHREAGGRSVTAGTGAAAADLDAPGADDTRAEARRLARVSASFARGELAPGTSQSGNDAR